MHRTELASHLLPYYIRRRRRRLTIDINVKSTIDLGSNRIRITSLHWRSKHLPHSALYRIASHRKHISFKEWVLIFSHLLLSHRNLQTPHSHRLQLCTQLRYRLHIAASNCIAISPRIAASHLIASHRSIYISIDGDEVSLKTLTSFQPPSLASHSITSHWIAFRSIALASHSFKEWAFLFSRLLLSHRNLQTPQCPDNT